MKFYNLKSKYGNSLLWLVLVCALSACSPSKWFSDDEEDEHSSAKAIYQTAKNSLLTQKYSSAIENYEKLAQNYPFSPYARRGLIESAYANYKNEELDKAVALVQHFIKSYPDDPSLDYAYYLEGLCYLSMGRTLLNYVLPHDPTSKSPASLLKAFEVFSELYRRFPSSPYRPEAKYRLLILRNMLAIHEIRVASFYIKRGSYIAAVNRMKYMLERYEGAQHTPDGLYLMAVAYRRMGSEELAVDTLRVLRENYPNRIDENLQLREEILAQQEKSLLDQMRAISNTLLESIKVKPRY